MLYEVHRSIHDGRLHIINRHDTFYSVMPICIRHLGPWETMGRGELDDLRLHYRLMIIEQGFVVLYRRQLSLPSLEIGS